MTEKIYPLHHEDARPMYVSVLKDAFDAMTSELEELRKHEVELDLAKARIKELENELANANKVIEELKNMRTQAKIGDTIRIIEMMGEPNYSGRIGTVEIIDDMGQIHGTWGGCAIQPEHDRYEILQHA